MYMTHYKRNGKPVYGIVDYFVSDNFYHDYYREGDRYFSVFHDGFETWSTPATEADYRRALHACYLAWIAFSMALEFMLQRVAADSAIEAEYYIDKVGNDLLFHDFERVIEQYRRGLRDDSDVKTFLRNALFDRRYIGESASITARYEHYGMVCRLAESFC